MFNLNEILVLDWWGDGQRAAAAYTTFGQLSITITEHNVLLSAAPSNG